MKSLTKSKNLELNAHCIKDRASIKTSTKKTALKKRTCLMCNKLFNSKGPFNRRCPRCNRLISLRGNGNFHDTYVYKFAYDKNWIELEDRLA